MTSSWRHHWNSSIRSQDMKTFFFNINYFYQFFGFFHISFLQRNSCQGGCQRGPLQNWTTFKNPSHISVNWLNFFVWLSLLLEISGNMCIWVVCYPVCDIMNFQNYLSFLVKPFPYITKNAFTKKHWSSFLKEF